MPIDNQITQILENQKEIMEYLQLPQINSNNENLSIKLHNITQLIEIIGKKSYENHSFLTKNELKIDSFIHFKNEIENRLKIYENFNENKVNNNENNNNNNEIINNKIKELNKLYKILYNNIKLITNKIDFIETNIQTNGQTNGQTNEQTIDNINSIINQLKINENRIQNIEITFEILNENIIKIKNEIKKINRKLKIDGIFQTELIEATLQLPYTSTSTSTSMMKINEIKEKKEKKEKKHLKELNNTKELLETIEKQSINKMIDKQSDNLNDNNNTKLFDLKEKKKLLSVSLQNLQ